MITCQECRERLNDLLDETSVSSKDNALRAMQAHVAECAQCRHDLAILRAAQSELRAFPQVAAPSALRARVLAELQQETAKKPAPQGFLAAFEAFLQRPQRLAWAGGVLATACFLVLISRTPPIQNLPATQMPGSATLESAATPQENTRRGAVSNENVDKKAETSTKRGDLNAALKATSPAPRAAKRDEKPVSAPKSNRATNELLAVDKIAKKSQFSGTARTRLRENAVGADAVADAAAGTKTPQTAVPSAATPNVLSPTPKLGQPAQPVSKPNIPAASPRMVHSQAPQKPQVFAVTPRPITGNSKTGSAESIASAAAPATGPAPENRGGPPSAVAGGFGGATPASPAVSRMAPAGSALNLAVPPAAKPSAGLAESATALSPQHSTLADSTPNLNGPNGSQGPTGPTGATGAMGPRGPRTMKSAPVLGASNSIAANGGEAPRGATGVRPGAGAAMMRGPRGPEPENYAAGAQGAPGAPGSSDLAAGGISAAPPALLKADTPKENEKPREERQVLQRGTAREVTLNFLPARDGNATQLRLVLPPSVRFADEKKSLILFNGPVKQGQNIRVTAPLVAREIGTQPLRLILEQNAGGTFTPLQTQTISIEVVR